MRSNRRAWVALLATIVLGALVQGATAIPGYAGVDSVAFRLALIASLLALAIEAVALPWAASAIGRRTRLAGPPTALIVWAVVIAFCAVLVATLVPLATPVLWVIALIVLPGAALGRWSPLAAFRPWRVAPWRASIAVLVMLLTGVLGVVVALTTGLFLTGILGGVITWLWVGVVGAALMIWWARLLPRARA